MLLTRATSLAPRDYILTVYSTLISNASSSSLHIVTSKILGKMEKTFIGGSIMTGKSMLLLLYDLLMQLWKETTNIAVFIKIMTTKNYE